MSGKMFEKIIPDGLKHADIIPFHHKGEWAIHEALPILLSHTGPASVRIETFNVSESALRPMFFLCEEGLITNLKMILDNNVKRHKLEILLFAAGITPGICTTSCHAKVLLIENEYYRVGIVGSANANQPIRYEAGILFTNETIFSFFKQQFDEVYNNDSIPFEWE